jgi:hypothetical protein
MDRLGEFGMAPHPIAVAPDVDDVAAVEQPVQERGGHHLVTEDPAPLLEALVRGQDRGGTLVAPLAAIATPVLGTAGGATLAGARFLPALAGSATGFGVALLHFVRPIVDPNDNFVLYIAIPSIVQAGITTLIASRWKA